MLTQHRGNRIGMPWGIYLIQAVPFLGLRVQLSPVAFGRFAFFLFPVKLPHSKRAIMEIKDFTVLLVEDELNDIFLVKRAFKMANLETPLQVVTDGEEATHYLSGKGKYADRKTHPLPGLIVMDIKMPRMSGFDVLEWIKHDGRLRRIPVIIVSSSDRSQDIDRAYELGANAYMVKPVNFRAVERLFESITHYWGLECAKPGLEVVA
jgi:CheY-like chemotaxis protein